MKVLFASDGSECSDRAARYFIKSLRTQVKNLKVTLFYVDLPMLGRVAGIHRENSDESLEGARQLLKRAEIAFDETHTAGNAAYHISKKAAQGKYGFVLMGTHGRSALKNVLLGSVTARVLSECAIPVLVVH